MRLWRVRHNMATEQQLEQNSCSCLDLALWHKWKDWHVPSHTANCYFNMLEGCQSQPRQYAWVDSGHARLNCRTWSLKRSFKVLHSHVIHILMPVWTISLFLNNIQVICFSWASVLKPNHVLQFYLHLCQKKIQKEQLVLGLYMVITRCWVSTLYCAAQLRTELEVIHLYCLFSTVCFWQELLHSWSNCAHSWDPIFGSVPDKAHPDLEGKGTP